MGPASAARSEARFPSERSSRAGTGSGATPPRATHSAAGHTGAMEMNCDSERTGGAGTGPSASVRPLQNLPSPSRKPPSRFVRPGVLAQLINKQRNANAQVRDPPPPGYRVRVLLVGVGHGRCVEPQYKPRSVYHPYFCFVGGHTPAPGYVRGDAPLSYAEGVWWHRRTCQRRARVTSDHP